MRDVPDLLDSIPNLNETKRDEVEIKHRENLRSILNNTLMTLVKNIQESNSAKDKAQLKDLLKMIRDQYPDEQESDEGIARLVESFKDDSIRLDIPKLKEILFKFELSKHNHAIETNEVHNYNHHHKSSNHLDDQLTNVHSKINVNPHEFKPNHAGTLLSYDSHHPEYTNTSQEDEE